MSTFGTFKDLSTQFEVGQDSEVLYGQFEVGQDSAELLGEADIQQLGSVELLGKFEAQGVADLLANVEVQQSGSAELLGKFEAQDVADLLGKFETQAIADLLGKFDVGQDSLELLGKFESQAIAELLGDAIIKNSNYAELLGKADIGQNSAELLSKFEAQGVADLLGKFEAQGIADLLGKAVVAQGSAEFLGKGVVMGADSSDLKCIADIEHSADLLGKAVFGHPALPVWLKAIFLTGLTNAYRDLSSILALRRAASVESLGKAVVKQSGSEELYSNVVIRHEGVPFNLFSKGNIKNEGPAELLCNFAVQNIGNLRARLIVGPAKNSDAYFSFWDPSDWINEVVGIGQGFIAIPWVEADSDVKTSGSSSARLTSVSGPGLYKEIRFGWGGMNWGVEAAVSPEVAPTPIDTDGRGPRRGSRASRDERREVPQSSYKELKAQFFVEMAILPGGLWDYQIVWQTDPTAVLEIGVLQGQIEIDPATGAITARTRHAINDRAIVTMCGGYRAYSKGTFTFDAEASIYGGANPVYTPAFGLIENKYDWFAGGGGAHAAMLYSDGAGNWYFYTEDGSDTESTLITGIDFTAQHTYRIIWEDATEYPATGRVRLWIDDVLKATHTVAVPTTPLLFFLLMNTDIVAYSEDDVWTKLHSFSVTGDT